MASIRSSIELYDGFSSPLMDIANAVNTSISAMDNLQRSMNRNIDTTSISNVQEQMNETTASARDLNTAIENISSPSDISIPEINVPEEIEVPVTAVVEEQPQINVPDDIDVPITPIITEQPQIDVPENMEVSVTPVVTEQPQIETPEDITVDVSVNGVTDTEQQIAELTDRLNSITEMQTAIKNVGKNLYVLPEDAIQNIMGVNREISQMQQAIEFLKTNPFNLDSSIAEMQIKAMSDSLDELVEKQQQLDNLMGNVPSQLINVDVQPNVPDPLVENPDTIPVEVQPNAPPEAVEIPITWDSEPLEVFTDSGIERFEQEVQSTNNMLNTLNRTQSRIAQTASQTNIFPQNMVSDMSNMQNRLQAIQQQITTIENNPMNMGTDVANAELEQLRGQLNQAIQEQEEMNRAIDNMDITAANDAYLRLSNTVGNTERYIRDNTDEQGKFNRAIEDGNNNANQLQDTIKKAVGAFIGVAGIKKAFSFVEDCTNAFDTQINAETQLMGVLANMLEADYVSQFELETTADTTGAIDDINAIQNSVGEVVVPVTAESKALMSEFDQITAKASEIQSQGIYGDEAMIAAGAEFATYFTDVDAITTMMDTLSNYAMGMSGGGEIDSTAMVDYATNLGKIMTGSYDAMSKKGFEFTEAQKAIIEGEATEAQIVDALGAEYVDMSSDMQAAAAITQVIDDSWADLYKTMSNTPQGRIIQLTNKWGDMKEMIGSKLYPAVLLFVDIINNNWGTIESVVNGIIVALQYLLGVLSWVMEAAINVAGFFTNNWSIISPIIWGLVAAFAAYNAVLLINKIYTGLVTAVKTIAAVAAVAHGAAITDEMIATTGMTAAQIGLNAALYACPITWILAAIIAVVVALYAAVAAVNEIAGTTISATGIIAAAIFTIGAYIINNFILAWNIVSAFVEFLVNVWHNPQYAIKAFLVNVLSAFLNFALACITGTQDMVGTIVGLWYAFSQAVANVIVVIYNFFKDGIENIVNGWNTGIYNIKTFFIGLASMTASVASSILSNMGQAASGIANMFISAINVAIGALNGLVDAMNVIPGVNIGKVSELGEVSLDFGASALKDTASDLLADIGAVPEKWEAPELATGDVGDAFVDGYMIGQDLVSGAEDSIKNSMQTMQDWLGETPEDYWEAPKLDYINLSDAAVAGYDFGENLADSVSNALDPSSLFNLEDLPTSEDLANSLASGIDPSGGIGDDVGDIADNTGNIAKELSASEDELKYLRDIAEQEAINRFTTAEINIEQTNHNNISSDDDLDGIVSGLTDAVDEAVNIITEGDHI